MILKKIIKVIFIILCLITWVGVFALDDYTWQDSYINNNDYFLYKKYSNVLDLTCIYCWFKQPVNSIGLVDKNETKYLGNNIYFIKLIWVNKEFGSSKKTEVFSHFTDCYNKKNGWLKNGNNIPDINTDMSTVKWSSFSDNKEVDDSQALYEEQCKFLQERFKK